MGVGFGGGHSVGVWGMCPGAYIDGGYHHDGGLGWVLFHREGEFYSQLKGGKGEDESSHGGKGWTTLHIFNWIICTGI